MIELEKSNKYKTKYTTRNTRELPAQPRKMDSTKGQYPEVTNDLYEQFVALCQHKYVVLEFGLRIRIEYTI